METYGQNGKFFCQHFQPVYKDMQKNAKLDSVQCLHFEFIDSLENNGVKWLIFEASCKNVCIPKASDVFTNVGRHRELSTFCIRHNLFHQSELGTDVELQKTQFVLLDSPRDMMQVIELSAQVRPKW